LYLASKDYGLNLSKSVLIGDKYTDIQAGQNAGIQTNILFNRNYASKLRHEKNYHIIKNLNEAECLL
jgi:D-glycero-D-manno-heptose 1,7-bisphosphate phosphatase